MALTDDSGAKKSLSVEEEIAMIKEAPIEDVAAYLRVDLETAVKLRVDKAVSDTYDKIAARQGVIAEDLYAKWAAEQGQAVMDITVRPIEPQGNLYGFASVTVGGIKIDDFKIVENKDGELFVGMPSKPDKTSKTGYRNTVFVDKDFKDDFSAAVIGKYNAAVQAHNREDKPERMADQMAKAKKEADRHNAALPPKDKSDIKRGERD